MINILQKLNVQIVIKILKLHEHILNEEKKKNQNKESDKKKPMRRYKKQEDSRKAEPTTIVGMVYKDFRTYKKRTGLG